jgi:hypothetical protein
MLIAAVHLGDAAAVVAAVAGAASAMAAAFAARASRASVERAHRPFVYGEPGIKSAWEGPPAVVAVRLHNDGTGVALDVRFRLEAVDQSWHGEQIPPARAMQPGEALPPFEMDDQRYHLERPPERVHPFELVTRYTDTAGRHWETRNQRHPPGPLRGPIRLRGRSFQFWWSRRDW